MDNRSNKMSVDNISNVITLEPPIPEGYDYYDGSLEEGFVIKNLEDQSQFVWVPVNRLQNNGTLDNTNFSEQLGRRNFYNWKSDEFINSYDEMNPELYSIIRSVKKYGGFYISRYRISDILLGKPRSIFSRHQWFDAPFCIAKEFAFAYSKNKKIHSHLPYGCEYDSVLQWQFQNFQENLKTRVYYYNDGITKRFDLVNLRNHHINNIEDFAWRTPEWTQESSIKANFKVVRSGSFEPCINFVTLPGSRFIRDKNYGYFNVGFRIALTLIDDNLN